MGLLFVCRSLSYLVWSVNFSSELLDVALGKFTVGGFQTALDLSPLSFKYAVVNVRKSITIKTVANMNEFLLLACGLSW